MGSGQTWLRRSIRGVASSMYGLCERSSACRRPADGRIRRTGWPCRQRNWVGVLRPQEYVQGPAEKFFVDADKVGNLGSASIWVALHHLRASGKLKSGDNVLILGAEATKYLYGGFVYTHA